MKSMIPRVLLFAITLGNGLCAQEPASRPVAAGAARDVHSYARPELARTTALSLDWTLDLKRRVIEGVATFGVTSALGAHEIILDTRDLVIEGVDLLVGERSLPAIHRLGPRDPHLGAPLWIGIQEGVTGIVVRYRTSPAATGLQWLVPEQTATKSAPYVYSQAQAIHARSFIPCQDTPGNRITWEAVVRGVPKGMTVVMSAEREERPGGTYAFKMRHPVPTYLIAFAAGNLAFQAIGPRTGVWAEPGVVARAASEFADLEKMIAAVESTFGPYRWGRYDVLVLPPSFPFGGMENPLMTFATPTLLAGDRSLVNVIAHELAHSWSGNLVTNATWRDFWLNEGFTVYIEGRIIDVLYGARVGVQQRILGRNELLREVEAMRASPGDTILHIDLRGRDPDDGMTSVPYEKGRLFLEMIERAVGRAKFDPFLKAWFDEHAFRSVTTADFERFLRERLFRDDPAAWERLEIASWLHEAGIPGNAPQFDETVFDVPAKAAAGVASGVRDAAALGAESWTTDEWLHFLERLPAGLAKDRLAALDARWKLTSTGNAEIAAAWFKLAISSGYEPAYAAIEEFLRAVGRRKFLRPLYAEMAKTPEGLERARAIYRKARPGYHAIATQTLDAILGASESRPAPK